MTVKALRDQALTLPISQRLSLVEELWDSIAEDQKSLPLSDAHGSIIDERLAADNSDPSAVVSWKNAVQHARRKISAKSKFHSSRLA